jgi:hypothetical protein
MEELQYIGYSVTFELIHREDAPLMDQVRRYPGYKNSYFDEKGKLHKE